MPAPSTAVPDATTLRRLGWVLLGAAAWTALVWMNRLVNLGYDDREPSFLVVHFAIAVVSLGFAAVLAWWGWRLRRIPAQGLAEDPVRETEVDGSTPSRS